MQKFTYHTHNNNFGIYDGRSTAANMIARAEELGFEEIGVSNHLCYHPCMPTDHAMFFDDYQKAEDLCKRNIHQLREEALNHKIKVRVGFEVDYFDSKEWRNAFEKLISKLNVDYYIGATHFLKDATEENVFNLYHLQKYAGNISKEELDTYLHNYWDNLVALIKSDYFAFVAHLDQPKLFNLCLGQEWDDDKYKVIDALTATKLPYEINTSGITKIGENHQYPENWIIKQLRDANVPVLISDDAHCINDIGQHFEKAELLLSELNYTNRFLGF